MTIFERKPLVKLFVKTKRPQDDYDDGLLTLWKISLDSSDIIT
jgi:hypothetical protein